VEESIPGKSHALNRAIPMISDGLVCFVDDDHRVDRGYFVGVAEAAKRYPSTSMFCGRILPDWDGREPSWVHDTGPYRIYPLPVPRYDEGDQSREITTGGPAPGGGNLCVRREVFDRVGGFSTDLGPHGHDLGGGEDSDFVYRCLAAGERIRYVPAIRQYHYVDPERLRFGYLLRKSFQRSRSGIRSQSWQSASVPLYMWRKLATYLTLGVASLSWPRTRFYLVRFAAALGELRGFLDKAHGPRLPGGVTPAARRNSLRAARWLTFPLLAVALGMISTERRFAPSLTAVFWVALVITGALLLKSFYDFSQTGPPLKREILRHYRAYSVLALARLAFWAFVLCGAMASVGVLLYGATVVIAGAEVRLSAAVAAAFASVSVLTMLQFCRHLLFVPGSIAASYHYRSSRLYPIWRRLTPEGLRAAQSVLGAAAIALIAGCGWRLASLGEVLPGAGFLLLAFIGPLGIVALATNMAPRAVTGRASRFPNIVMIGSDTLRTDRIARCENSRNLTPFIDSLVAKGTLFTSCYVPCARTAPSLISLLTGTWPHRHGIRDNFVSDDETHLAVPALAAILAQHGYRTAAVSDWCGGDLGKFPLGFHSLDLPDDQWNIKYLIRQGPKDLRLFLSLFTHNRFGKWFLPELYYLAGVPLTSLVGRDARALISRFAPEEAPFFLNIFMSTTHPPFGSEYPYYTLWSDKDYAGESKFVMARLTDPWEIIRRQGDSKKDFDLDQIIDLYDGCVRNFDHEVKRIVEHVKACGLADNTIIVIYSDHGMEFFEHETWGQGNSVRGDFSARVPLVIADPRIGGSGCCGRVVRTIDVAPTLLELVGIAPQEGMDGVSLVPYLKGAARDMNLAAFNETGIWLTDLPGMPANHLRYPGLLDLLEVPDKLSGTLAIKLEYREAIIAAKDRMVRQGPWKLTYQPTSDGPLYALFDLASDPECRHDVAEAHPDIVRELQSRLSDWISGGAPAASSAGRSIDTAAKQT
jgi:arylsulfatase A-like enzyme/GT2 family glycosyltransferase